MITAEFVLMVIAILAFAALSALVITYGPDPLESEDNTPDEGENP